MGMAPSGGLPRGAAPGGNQLSARGSPLRFPVQFQIGRNFGTQISEVQLPSLEQELVWWRRVKGEGGGGGDDVSTPFFRVQCYCTALLIHKFCLSCMNFLNISVTRNSSQPLRGIEKGIP